MVADIEKPTWEQLLRLTYIIGAIFILLLITLAVYSHFKG
jgi:hypothetical protein